MTLGNQDDPPEPQPSQSGGASSHPGPPDPQQAPRPLGGSAPPPTAPPPMTQAPAIPPLGPSSAAQAPQMTQPHDSPVPAADSPDSRGHAPDWHEHAPDSLSADRALLGEPARQAMIAVVFIALKFIRGLGAVQIGILVVFIVSGRLPGGLIAAGFGASVVGLVIMTLSWWRFTFVVAGDELVVNKGILAQERLTIPLDRVQSVSINQSFLHRFVGVVSASVDTAGSSSAEFEIDAVDRERAEALQRLVAGHFRGGATTADAGAVGQDGGVASVATRPAVEDRVVINRTPMELARIGATRWPWAGLVALAPLLAVLDDLQGVLPFDLEDGEELLPGELPSDFGATLVAFIVVGVFFIIIMGAVLGTVLQVVREVVTNWDMKLIRTETGLRRTAGLFSTTSKASTLNRIQAVQTDQTPAQRLFGIQKLTLPTIGDGDIGVPGATDQEVATLRDILFRNRMSTTPGAATAGEPVSVPAPAFDREISRLSVFLAVRNNVLFVVPAMIVASVQVGWWALLLLLLIPMQWLIARRRWRLRRWSLSTWRIGESYELVNRHTAELDLIKTQTVSVSRSFFERRRGLATVKIETAEGHLAVPLITLEEANAVRDRALFAAESDRRTWM